MVGFLDIGPATEDVTVAGKRVTVQQISVKSLFGLVRRFPELQAAINGEGLKVDQIIAIGETAVSAFIAAGLGRCGDPDTEQAVGNLPLDAAAEIILQILKVTMPNGIRPFADRFSAMLMPAAEGAASDGEPPAKSYKVRAIKSHAA